MTVPDSVISLAVLEEHKYRENRYAAERNHPRGPWQDQSGPVASARQRLRATFRTLASTIDPPQAELTPGGVPESGD